MVSQGLFLSGDSSLDAPVGTVYLGTVANIRGLADASWDGPGICKAWGPLHVIDLPLSLAMDTVLLPVCLIETLFFWDPPEEEAEEAPATPST